MSITHIIRQKLILFFQSHVNAAGRIGIEHKHMMILGIADVFTDFILAAAINVAIR